MPAMSREKDASEETEIEILLRSLKLKIVERYPPSPEEGWCGYMMFILPYIAYKYTYAYLRLG
jgi:hypothetical protein